MDGPGLPPKLLSTLSKAADIVRRHNFIHLYSHYDADGITSISIVASAIMREGIDFETTIFPVLSQEQMDVIRDDDEDCIILTDLGASYVEEIEALRGDSVILDHHEPKFTEPEKTAYANPHLYGVDGGKNACGATMALLFAVTLDDSNWNLSPLAMAGMIGDMQTKDGLFDFNRYVFEEAERRGFVKKMPGSLIPDGDLFEGLSTCTAPYIRGVSDDPRGTEELLDEAGIRKGTAYADLDEDRKQKLSSLIALRLTAQGVTEEKMREAVHDRYYMPTYGMDGATLSAILDACGRNDMPDVGIAAAMGDEGCLKHALEFNRSLARPFLDAIRVADAELQQMENIQWFDCTSTGSGGLLASVIVSYLGVPNKPCIAINSRDEMANVSSRGTETLLTRGLNLCDTMREACAAAGGEGGGHKIASGGKFPRDNRQIFLDKANEIVGNQLRNAR